MIPLNVDRKPNRNMLTPSTLKIFSKITVTHHPDHSCQLQMACCGLGKSHPVTHLVLAVPLCPFCGWSQVVLAIVCPEGSHDNYYSLDS